MNYSTPSRIKRYRSPYSTPSRPKRRYQPPGLRGSRAPDAPGGRGKASARTGPGGTSKFKRAWNKLDIFRSVPSINHTHLDLHTPLEFTLRAGLADEDSYHVFCAPLEVTTLEPLKHQGFTITDQLFDRSKALFPDSVARGYPCNQLLALYNNFAVKSAEVKVDCRLVVRTPGGALQGASPAATWDQAGQVTIPVNLALLRVTKSELDYLINSLPTILKSNDEGPESFDGGELSNFDRVLREQFGVCPLTLGSHRREGLISTTWKASVADSCKESDIIEDISDSYKGTAQTPPNPKPSNGHLGVTSSDPAHPATIVVHPPDTHFMVILGWLSPMALGENLTAGPSTREVQVVMDCHIRQYIALGDVVETKAGISSGGSIITRI
jgi:hypothetical protein